MTKTEESVKSLGELEELEMLEVTGKQSKEKRTFFEKIRDLVLAELANIAHVAIVPQKRQYIIGEHVGIGVRSVAKQKPVSKAQES